MLFCNSLNSSKRKEKRKIKKSGAFAPLFYLLLYYMAVGASPHPTPRFTLYSISQKQRRSTKAMTGIEWCRILVRVLVDVVVYGRVASEEKNVHQMKEKRYRSAAFQPYFYSALKYARVVSILFLQINPRTFWSVPLYPRQGYSPTMDWISLTSTSFRLSRP